MTYMSKKSSNRVKIIFNRISSKYDFLNNLLSFGLHKLWKRNLIKLLKPKDGEIWADLCCGTGDLSFLINKKVFPNGYVYGVDNANEILDFAKFKSKSRGISYINYTGYSSHLICRRICSFVNSTYGIIT